MTGDESPRPKRRGVFERIIDASFKVDRQGRCLFFPWGAGLQGYVVPSEEDRARVSRSLARLTKFGTLAGIVLVGVVGPTWLLLITLPPLCLGYFIWLRRMMRGWQPAEEGLSLRESLAAQADALGRPLVWTFLTCAATIVVTETWFLFARPDEWLFSTAAISFFGLCAVGLVGMILASPRQRRDPA